MTMRYYKCTIYLLTDFIVAYDESMNEIIDSLDTYACNVM